jgi:hypothetical protein
MLSLPAGRRSRIVMLSGVEAWLAECHPSTPLRMTEMKFATLNPDLVIVFISSYICQKLPADMTQ